MFAFADGSRLTIVLPVVACVLASFVLFLACLCYFVSFDLLRLRVMVLRVGAACGCAIMRGAAGG